MKTDTPTAPVIRIQGVSLRYGDNLALDNLNLDIPANRMVGLIGPDGVGKSSLMSLLTCARKMQEGRIIVLDGDIADAAHRRAVFPRIAYMPQGLGKNLYLTLSVFENVDFFGRLFCHEQAERHQRIAELLESTGLETFRDRPAGKLSGGMKQKLGLCCALNHDPDLLVLDEPTIGVDPLSRAQFWNLIDRLRARRAGMSVLVSTPTWTRPSVSTGWSRWMQARSSPPVRRRNCERAQAPTRWKRLSSGCCRKQSARATRTL